MSRLLGSSLDNQLASGRPAESSRLLAARAAAIVSPPVRDELSRSWRNVLSTARGTAQSPLARRMPMCRNRILDAEHDVEEMLKVLTSDLPLSAQGVAMSSVLITDGTGPLYNQRSPIDLHLALMDARRQLDPAVSLAHPS